MLLGMEVIVQLVLLPRIKVFYLTANKSASCRIRLKMDIADIHMTVQLQEPHIYMTGNQRIFIHRLRPVTFYGK